MSLLSTIIVAVLLGGFAVWLLQFLPIADPFNRLAQGLILFAVVCYVLAVLLGFASPVTLPLRTR